ncbi:MAG: biotin/lipoyl-binding protein [Bacteroidetes bacterium]|nr:biotin/lipoyl-binding protein [Bacteroidota bacterium]
MKKAFYFIAVLFIIGCAKEKKPAEGSVKGVAPAQSVQVVVVQQQALENSINATGTVLSNEEVEIRSEIQGRITGVYFKEGERVQSGKLLVKIDVLELKAQLKRQNSAFYCRKKMNRVKKSCWI